MESFGRLGGEDNEFTFELATHAAGRRDGGTVAREGVYKERLLQVVSVATQVAISRRVQRYKLAPRRRPEVEDQRTRSTSSTSTPMLWRYSVHCTVMAGGGMKFIFLLRVGVGRSHMMNETSV